MHEILVQEKVTIHVILYLKCRNFFWMFCFLTIRYKRAVWFGLYNVHYESKI